MATQLKKETESIQTRNKWLEKFLCLIIILCPILDCASFIFRNFFQTTISVSTIIRPIIPLCLLLYIFIKGNKKEKIILSLIAVAYIGYAAVHLLVYNGFHNGCAFGDIKLEMQYVFNFSFVMIYFIVFAFLFLKKDLATDKLYNSITIMATIYVVSIFLAIIMGQSSYTYTETSTGYKGWIESGNSLSAILIMSLFIMLQRVREKKITILVIVAVAAYLITTIGTRTGLFGTFIAVGLYLLLEMFFSRNKKIIIAGLSLMTIAVLVVIFAGSKTIQRRQQMNQSQYTIIDEATGEVGNMTGDMLRIKNKILNNTLEEGYMSEAQKQSVLDLHEYTKSVKLAGNDTRTQQLMYNMYLMKNQGSFIGIVFGNGYNNNEREMRMENELASLFLNFGLCGFILYACPILAVLIYAIVFGIKKRKDITLSYVMNVAALILAIGLSWLSGYVLFATSSMTVIVVVATLLLVEIKKIKDKNRKM